MRNVAFQSSAGGVIIGERGVCLIRTRNFRGDAVWTFPKGRVEPGERSDEAALREVREETGYACQLVRPLAPTSFWFRRNGQLIKKTVSWFLLRAEREVGVPDAREVDEVAWLPYDEAHRRLTFNSDQGLLTEAWGEITRETERV